MRCRGIADQPSAISHQGKSRSLDSEVESASGFNSSARDDRLGNEGGDAEPSLAGRAGAPVPTFPEEVQALFGIVQGGMDRALRKESAERTIEIGFDGYAIGGLSVGEPRALTREIVESTLEHLPER